MRPVCDVHRLLRHLHRPESAADEGDLRRGAQDAEGAPRSLPATTDGTAEGTWIVADYLDVVLHVFTPEARAPLRARGPLERRSLGRARGGNRVGGFAKASWPSLHCPATGGRSSVGRASGWQPEGQGFESPRLQRSLAAALCAATSLASRGKQPVSPWAPSPKACFSEGVRVPRPPCRSRRRMQVRCAKTSRSFRFGHVHVTRAFRLARYRCSL